MYKIVIENTDLALEAINWCMGHVGVDDWSIKTKWPMKGVEFSFNNIKDASWFGLTWTH